MYESCSALCFGLPTERSLLPVCFLQAMDSNWDGNKEIRKCLCQALCSLIFFCVQKCLCFSQPEGWVRGTLNCSEKNRLVHGRKI